MSQSLPPITSFFSNKIQSTEPDFEEYLIDIANIFAEFDGQVYDYSAVTERFRQLSDRPIDRQRDPSDFRDEYGAYGNFLGIMKVVYENNNWVWKLSNAASKLLCGEEPNVRAFLRVQLSLFQYPLLIGMVYYPNSLRIQPNTLASLQRIIEAQIKVVPLRLIFQSLQVKSKMMNVSLTEASITYKEILFLFNNSSTSTTYNPSEAQIEEVLTYASTAPLFVDQGTFRKFYRNFHIFEKTGLIKRLDDGLRVNLDEDIESHHLKQKMIDSIAAMNSFCEYFYNKPSSEPIKNHLYQMVYEGAWAGYYDGGQLPQEVYSILTLESSKGEDISSNNRQHTKDLFQLPINISPVNAPPLVERQSSSSPPRLYKLVSSPADPEVTRLKREKSNTYHRFLVDIVTSRLQSIGCQPQESIYIDLAGKIEDLSILLEVKSCNAQNTTSQIRKAVSQVYEYRYRYNDDFPKDSSLLCIVLQERPEQWWIDYLVGDRDINIIWLEGEINLACASRCHNLIKRLVDIVE